MSRIPTGPSDRSRPIAPSILRTLLPAILALFSGSAAAAPGDTLFRDDFEAGFGKWSTTSSVLSSINSMTASSTSRSLYVRGSTVTTTSIAIDGRVPALRVRAWIRRGSDWFSEQPDSGEDLAIEYLDATGVWNSLGTWSGSGTAGAILALDQTVGGNALHAGFRLRIRLARGSGGPPDNGGIGWDYWHVDDVVVSEATPTTGLALGRCEEFDSGLTGWTVAGRYGQARTTSQAVNTPSQSLAIHGGTVTATSQAVDLSAARAATLRFWLRRGSDAFSEDPDVGEDFYVEFLNAAGQWKRLEHFAGDGIPGEIVQPSYSLSGSAQHAGFRLRFGMDGRDGPSWDYWHVDSVCLSSAAPTAYWPFEETAWSGAVGEVGDDSGGGYVGIASGTANTAFRAPAIAGDPGTCRHATLAGSGGVTIPSRSGLDHSAAVTYSIWMRPGSASGSHHVMGMGTSSFSSSRSQMALYAQDGALIGSAVTRAGTYSVKIELPALETWAHVALAFDGKSLSLYRDAVLASRVTFAETTLVASARSLGIGIDPESRSQAFLGELDEARIHPEALDASRIAALMREVRDCAATPVTYVVFHDGSGAHCQPETVRVLVRDLLGNTVTTHSGTITLDTQTGTGRWSLVDGDGALVDGVAEDGRATYHFETSDAGEASFALHYSTGPSSIDVDVYDANARDDDSEGLLSFSPSSFTATASAVPDPPPMPNADSLVSTVAGESFALHLTAFGGSSGGSACGVIATYEGDKGLRFWIEHVDPARGTLVPAVDGVAIATSEATAARQSVRFVAGRGEVKVHYKDAGRIGLHFVDASSSPVIRGATGAFVSLPADLRITSVSNGSGVANAASVDPDGALFARAGESFRVAVDALDAEGSITPSFGSEAIPEAIRLTSTALVAPAGGRNGQTDEGTIANATTFTPDTTPGRFVGTAFSFDEVGSIRLQASVADGDYLGAGAIVGSESDPVGRFAPFAFAVTANAPRFATACPVGAFTWLGQPFHFASGFEPELVVTAVNATGERTANYAGDWFRLTNASLANRRYSAGAGGTAVAVDESGLPAASTDPVITSNGDGSARLRFSSGSGLALLRATPRAPFEAELELALDVLDLDATAYASNPFRIGSTMPDGGIAFDGAKRFQHGRLRLENAFGSELVALPMALRTQRFDGTAFIDDDSDSCSRVPASALVLDPDSKALAAAAPQIAHEPLFGGDAGLAFTAPGAAGSMAVRIDLGATGANLPWLRFDWPEDGNLDGLLDDDPRARATFGIWEGRDALIFVRELY